MVLSYRGGLPRSWLLLWCCWRWLEHGGIGLGADAGGQLVCFVGVVRGGGACYVCLGVSLVLLRVGVVT